MRGKIDFKGTKDGFVLVIKGDLTFDWIQILVQRKLKLARHFFDGAHIIGSYGYTFSEEQESILGQLISAQSGMKVLNLETYDIKRNPGASRQPSRQPALKEDASQTRLEVLQSNADIGVETDELTIEKSVFPPSLEEEQEGVEAFTYGTNKHGEEVIEDVSDTVFHRGTLRSGRKIVSRGNIVVLGDVNPGAELIARGNIIVMGTMRGFAHAGSDGNEKAFVAAIRLMPTQLRIDKFISRPPDEGHGDTRIPEIAYVHEGHMIIEPYL